ncbi:hypothetical protein [Roseateles sp.]|uniref:hypothetical protein n=1 Tax=Roseateles sp. TaxID=1971397 RepID=UPI0039ECE0D7
MTEALDRGRSPRLARADNGILSRVPGQYIAKASKSLPDPACALDDEMCVEIDAARVGRVRLTFKKQRYGRPLGNTSYFSWLCRHAEPAPMATPNCSTRGHPNCSGQDEGIMWGLRS